MPDRLMLDCPTCDGEGYIEKVVWAFLRAVRMPCPDCLGSGAADEGGAA